MKLTNGYGLMIENRHGCVVKAIFRGQLDVVFEGLNRKECIKYCHDHGMKAISEFDYLGRSAPYYTRKNAKHPFNPAEWFVGTV